MQATSREPSDMRRPLWISAGLLVLTPVLGILVRFGLTALPWTARKYGGSVLWAAMVYWTVSTLLWRTRPWVAALAAVIVATSVEFLKLVHTPLLEQFRDTTAGVLLLGKQFGWLDLVAYGLAITSAALFDNRLRHRSVQRAQP